MKQLNEREKGQTVRNSDTEPLNGSGERHSVYKWIKFHFKKALCQMIHNVRNVLLKWTCVVSEGTMTRHAASFSALQQALAPRSRQSAPVFLQIHFLSLGTSLMLLAQ